MAEQCGLHERTMERVAKVEAKCDVNEAQGKAHEGEVSDLYLKYNEFRDALNQNKICLEKLGITMSEGFKVQNTSLESIKTDISELNTKYDKNNQAVDKEIKDVKTRLDDLNRFEWFRKRMNRWRDNLPACIICGLLGIIIMLVSLHWADFDKVKWFGR